MIAVYLRVSTGRQDTEVQKQDIDSYCNTHSIAGYTIFKDVVSGSSTNRPEYQKLKAAVALGQIKKIICYKIDRLGRRAIDLVDDMIYFFKAGCDVIFTSQEQLSLAHDDPFSLTKISIFAELAEMERRHISERTKLGLANAKKKNPSLGKRKDIAKRKKIAELLSQGMTTRQIVSELRCTEKTIVDVRRCLASKGNVF